MSTPITDKASQPPLQSLYSQLFDADFMRKLERLSLVSRKLKAGQLKGERRSPRRGQSVEFADYRNYTHGDDLRRVDWNAYARMERLYIKLFQEEEDLTVHILLDNSKSMDWGDPNAITLTAPIAALDQPSRDTPTSQAGAGTGAAPQQAADTRGQNKLVYTKRVAAALGYIALANLDRLSLSAFSQAGLMRFPATRGKGNAVNLLRFVASIPSQGTTDLDLSLKQYASQARFPGLLFVLSDCLVKGGGTAGLAALQAAGHEVNLIHTLAPAELQPELALMGDLRLRDVETGVTREVSIDSGVLEAYRANFQVWQQEIENFCRRRGINYLQVQTDQPFEDLILSHLRAKGML